MTKHKHKLSLLLILTLLLMTSAVAFADGGGPETPPPDNTTTYLFNINGYWIAMTPLAYFIDTMGYGVCVALMWC